MKKETVRSGLQKFLRGKGKHFISRERFLRSLDSFDEDIRAECLRRLGGRSKLMFSVAQAILSEAHTSVQKKPAKTVQCFAPIRFKLTPGLF